MPYQDPLGLYITCKGCGEVIELHEDSDGCPYCHESIDTKINRDWPEGHSEEFI